MKPYHVVWLLKENKPLTKNKVLDWENKVLDWS